MIRVHIPLNVIAPHLRDADVLSYRLPPAGNNPLLWPSWISSKSIAVAGRGDEIHTGMVKRSSRNMVLAMGMRLSNNNIKLIDDEVDAYPGLIDVYRYNVQDFIRSEGAMAPCLAPGALDDSTRRNIAYEQELFCAHGRYGFWSLVRTSGFFIPGIRWFTRPHYREIADHKRPPFCSQSVSFAFRKNHRPLLKRLSDWEMLPADIPRSPMLMYLCTLVPEVSNPSPVESYYDEAFRQIGFST